MLVVVVLIAVVAAISITAVVELVSEVQQQKRHVTLVTARRPVRVHKPEQKH
jgi:hypothetical protein